jgi:hypothetical protein
MENRSVDSMNINSVGNILSLRTNNAVKDKNKTNDITKTHVFFLPLKYSDNPSLISLDIIPSADKKIIFSFFPMSNCFPV